MAPEVVSDGRDRFIWLILAPGLLPASERPCRTLLSRRADVRAFFKRFASSIPVEEIPIVCRFGDSEESPRCSKDRSVVAGLLVAARLEIAGIAGTAVSVALATAFITDMRA
jgi:hypothetical protein